MYGPRDKSQINGVWMKPIAHNHHLCCLQGFSRKRNNHVVNVSYLPNTLWIPSWGTTDESDVQRDWWLASNHWDLALSLGQVRIGHCFRKPPRPLLRSCGNIYLKWMDHSGIFLKGKSGNFSPYTPPSPTALTPSHLLSHWTLVTQVIPGVKNFLWCIKFLGRKEKAF